MTPIGTDLQPLRVAIVGSGPAGFYTAESLLGRDGVTVEVDMFERLPAPYGLVRYGVAPDHEKIKNVTRVFDKKTASHPGFRFFGNVDVGQDVTLDQLRRHYHAVCFSSGAQTDRRMNIPGEDLAGSHPATEFVAWYNGHPDFRDYEFDLTSEHVAVVGVGNVAVDVARILCRTTDELATTDIAPYALEQLAESKVREVTMLGRRGPAQAAFTNPEVRELGQMEGATVRVLENEVTLDALTQRQLEADPDRGTDKKLEILRSFLELDDSSKSKRMTLRFLVSPVELTGDNGRVRSMKLVKNELVESEDGSIRPRATETFEDLPADLVFRSVGYRGVEIPGLPFHDAWGIVPNEKGQVVNQENNNEPVTGMFVSGWIKRGPSGVIGTNKPDGVETADAIMAQMEAGHLNQPDEPGSDSAESTIRGAQANAISFDDWRKLAEMEATKGAALDRPRVKFTSAEEALAALRG